MRFQVLCGWAALAVLGALAPALRADEPFLDFDNSGFQWLYDDFEQTLGPEYITLTDAFNGWGGGGITYGTPLDLSTMADSYFRIDTRLNAGNDAGQFTLALRDVNDNQGKWNINLDAVATGNWNTYTASTSLAHPQTGNNDWQNLDLSQIVNFELQGQWAGASAFNMSFDNLIFQTEGFVEKYPGQSPDAAWRTEAAQQIDQLRKADMNFVVRDEMGNAVHDATVQVRMQRHDFGFGSALKMSLLTSADPNAVIYRDKVKQLFNTAGNENALKWPAWDGEWGPSFSRETTLAGFDWLADNNIDARGHVMVWPGYNNLPSPVKAMLDEYNDPTTTDTRKEELTSLLRTTVLDHIQDITTATAGKLYAFDVVNEERANHDLMDILGDEAMVDWFNAARAANSDLQLFINEYDILTSGGSHADARDQYEQTIQYLLANGAPVGGIGVQSHFSAGNLTGPEALWAILDRFGALGLPIQITEFDMSTTDPDLQRDYMRDFITAIFAHEDVTDFIQWGFWAGAHWRPEAAMFDENWNLRPHGEEYLRLIFQEWWTDDDLITDLLGEASLRGFLGDYEVTVIRDGVPQTFLVSLDADGGTYILSVPEPAAVSLLPVAALLLLRRRRRVAA